MDERFYVGIREFNDGRFFEAHDILEDLWHGYCEPDRIFLRGLIQTAVGLYHLENGNLKGARSQLSKALGKLQKYVPEHWGISVGLLCASLKDDLGIIEEAGWNHAKGTQILIRSRIQLSSGKQMSIF